jgi:FtsZ-binding cell division protein ZapB
MTTHDRHTKVLQPLRDHLNNLSRIQWVYEAYHDSDGVKRFRVACKTPYGCDGVEYDMSLAECRHYLKGALQAMERSTEAARYITKQIEDSRSVNRVLTTRLDHAMKRADRLEKERQGDLQELRELREKLETTQEGSSDKEFTEERIRNLTSTIEELKKELDDKKQSSNMLIYNLHAAQGRIDNLTKVNKVLTSQRDNMQGRADELQRGLREERIKRGFIQQTADKVLHELKQKAAEAQHILAKH